MAAYFTGRERFALTLAGAVLRSRMTVMYGQSGCGKSSVLGAAFPQVMAATLQEPDEPAPGLPHRLLYFRRWHPGFETRLFAVAAAKLNAPRSASFATAIAGWARDQDPKPPVILVLDQFEEFLLYHSSPTETAFVRDLSTVVANPDIQARVLISLREDSLASLDALRAVIPGILSSPVQLRPLDRSAAEQAIRRPVVKWGQEQFSDPKAVEVEEALVETLLDQVRQTGSGGLATGAVSGSDPNLVELPLLQLSLERLWEEEAKADKPVLRLQTLDRLGGAPGIARQHLDRTLEALPAAQRALTIRLFGHLVTATGGKHAWRADDLAEEIGAHERTARQAAERTVFGRVIARVGRAVTWCSAAGRTFYRGSAVPTEQETDAAAITETLNKLASGNTRILRTQPDPRGQGPLFELYHDALARPVLAWVQEARITDAERRQRHRAAAAVGAALLMLAVVVVILVFYDRAVAQQHQAQLQESRAVSTLALQETDSGDAMTGMLAALAVLPKDQSRPDRPVSNAASAELLRAWLCNREKFDLLGHKGAVLSVMFSPDGKRVVTGSDDNTARVWDLSGPTPVATVLEGHKGAVWSVMFSPDGKRVVTGSLDHTARVWDVSGPTPVATVLEGHRGLVWSVMFSPDGKRVVTGSDDNTARVWDVSGPTPVATVLEGHRGLVWSVMFSPDGKRVVTGSDDNTARVWDVSGPTPVATVLEGHRGLVWSVMFSPDGKRVVTGSLDDTARVWDVSGPTPVATVLEGHRGLVWSVMFSPDGKRVVTGSDDNTARVWDVSGPTPVATVLEGHKGAVRSVMFSPDGKRVVTGSSDNTARAWNTPAIEELIPLARTALRRCLTIAQREELGLPILSASGQDRERVDPPPCP